MSRAVAPAPRILISGLGKKKRKSAFYAMQDMGFEEALDFLSGKLSEVAATQDAIEGIRAFLEKRPARWSGR